MKFKLTAMKRYFERKALLIFKTDGAIYSVISRKFFEIIERKN